ncbi:hypothetical protein [Bacillus zhangzhouensis]|uniref:hypothetical protein n=1 Tax=Bacillus zhangzhouensis TaxID=1178540 RepID=UPI003D20CAB9
MKIIDRLHPVHYASEKIEHSGLLKGFSPEKYGRGSTIKIYAKKLFKALGEYEVVFDTPIIDGVKRYTEYKNLQHKIKLQRKCAKFC